MIKYEVVIGEVISHSLEIVAVDELEAIEKAKWLICNFPDEELKKERNYATDSIGFDGYEEAKEI
tara:strand:- start:107 stop:301 length:195 start_codon:yes stop_codon:yes gene_type:complete